jgi:hypothetical protein
MTTSIRCEARISRTGSKKTQFWQFFGNFLAIFSAIFWQETAILK